MTEFNPQLLQSKLKVEFRNIILLEEAMTHKSFCVDKNTEKGHFERLEFLGDSVLNFVIAEELYLRFPQDPEGLLSKKRASLVNQETLNTLALRMNLQDFIVMGPGERKQNSHLKPRVMASCFEAVVGAIYLDKGFEAAKDFLLKRFKELDFKLDEQSGFETDYKTRLQEVTQKYKLGTPTYELIHSTGPSHQPVFLVALKLMNEEKARGEGASKKKAEQAAAEFYLNKLKRDYEDIE